MKVLPGSAGAIKHVVLQRALPGLVFAHGDGDDRRPAVALTFDDGPWPVHTERILRILADADARATFFMLGSSVRSHRALAREVAEQGMLIGNHGDTHRDLRGLSPEEIEHEILGASALIEEATSVRPRWFRPPYGKLPLPVLLSLRRLGMRGALWTVDSGDCLRPPARRIADAVLSRVRPGSIVLMHDGGDERQTTLAALPLVIEGLRERGYRFVALDELEGCPSARITSHRRVGTRTSAREGGPG